MSRVSPEAELEGFLAKFLPEIAGRARAVIAGLRARLPGATVIVYDNYNALAVGFGSTGKPGGVALSVAVYPRWVSLFLSGGPFLDDPHGLLKGEGGTVRHIVLASAADIHDPRITALIDQAVLRNEPPVPDAPRGVLIIKSVSAKQRPRRPDR